MRKLAGLTLLTLIMVAGCSQPDIRDTQGKGWRFDDLKGNWLVINYWATWCAPCIKEIPELIELDRNHADISVFGVNFDQPPPPEMARQIEKMKITFPVFDGDPYQRYGIEKPQVLPTTLIIAPDGVLKDVLVGPQTEASLLKSMGR